MYETDDYFLEVPCGDLAELVPRVDGVGQHLRVPEHPPMLLLLAVPAALSDRGGMSFRRTYKSGKEQNKK